MNDKINDAIEIHDFAIELIDELVEEGIIDNKEITLDKIRDLIIETLVEESKENSNVDQIELMKD